MLKSHYLILLFAFLSITGLSLLPKAVVSDEDESAVASSGNKPPESTTHSNTLSDENRDEMRRLQVLLNEDDAEVDTKLSVLDSIISIYQAVNLYDSAALAVESFAKSSPHQAIHVKVGNTYYEAFTFAVDAERVKFFGGKTREWLQKAIDENPKLNDEKVKVGMTYVASNNPMQGIMMIREVLNNEPDNELALFNLGVLSMQSNQYDRALGRFEKLIELDSTNTQAHFYLGLSLKELGQKERAIEELEIVKRLEKGNQEIINTVEPAGLRQPGPAQPASEF